MCILRVRCHNNIINKLSYRGGTVRAATRYDGTFVLCFTMYGIGSWKSFKQQKWPSRSLAMVPKFDDSSLNRSRDITGVPKFEVGHLTMTTPF